MFFILEAYMLLKRNIYNLTIFTLYLFLVFSLFSKKFLIYWELFKKKNFILII